MILTDKIGWGQPLVDKSLLYLLDAGEGSGSTTADRIAGTSAALNSGVSWKTSPYGNSYLFNGSTGIIDTGIDTPLDFERTDAFSVSALVYATGQSVIVDKTGANPFPGWTVFIDSGNIWFAFWNVFNDNSKYLRIHTSGNYLNGWHLVTATYDGSSLNTGLNIYVDGVLAPIATRQGTLSDSILNNNPLLIGNSLFGYHFAGSIKQVGIWDRELSLAEHQYMYRNVTTWPYLSVQEEVFRAPIISGGGYLINSGLVHNGLFNGRLVS